MRFAALLVVSLALLAPGSASGARAKVEKFPCTVEVPGAGTAEGTARNITTPRGHVIFVCQAKLPAGSAPPKTVRQRAGDCFLVATRSGHVTLTCRLRAL